MDDSEDSEQVPHKSVYREEYINIRYMDNAYTALKQDDLIRKYVIRIIKENK